MADASDREELARLVSDVAAYARYLGQIGDEYVSAAPSARRDVTAAPVAESIDHCAPSSAPAADPSPRVSVPSPMSQPVVQDLFDTGRRTIARPASDPARTSTHESLDAICADLGDCTRCKLHAGRTNIVFGQGDPSARLMFVGEGPGADEDATGLPFVGAAGKLLDRIIEAIGLKREQVYIANVVKCRPPGNRKPERDEMSTCEPFLFRQIDAIAPRVLVLLGNTPVESLLGLKGGITRLRGEFHEFRGIKVMPTFHPAYLLRDPTKKREVWEDMKMVKQELGL